MDTQALLVVEEAPREIFKSLEERDLYLICLSERRSRWPTGARCSHEPTRCRWVVTRPLE
jgi:hypothetical protein